MGADMGGVKPGDVVAVWGCGAVGQIAARAAQLLGAERVILIARFDYRLQMAERELGAEVLNYERTDIDGELRERTGGRGPDVCIEAIGMEAHTPGPDLPLRAGQAAAAAGDRPAPRAAPGHSGLPQGRHRVRARGLRRDGGQVPRWGR